MRGSKLWSVFAGRVHSNFPSQAFCVRTRGCHSRGAAASSFVVYRSWASVHGAHGLPFGAFFFLTKMGRDFAGGFDADLTLPSILCSYDGLTHSTPHFYPNTVDLTIHTPFNPRQKPNQNHPTTKTQTQIPNSAHRDAISTPERPLRDRGRDGAL